MKKVVIIRYHLDHILGFASVKKTCDHKVQTLLSLIGGKTYPRLKDLLEPEKTAAKSFQQIINYHTTAVLEHQPCTAAERFRF